VIEIGQHFAFVPEYRIKVSIGCLRDLSSHYQNHYCRSTNYPEVSGEPASL
jgi:hypothetical protein